MKKKMRQFAAGLLIAALFLGCAVYATEVQQVRTVDEYMDMKMRVGLAYEENSTGALVSANLWNVEGYGSGFRFGYYDEALDFVALGATEQTQITMTKAQTLYLLGTTFYEEIPEGSHRVLGGYHLQMPGAFSDYETARVIAEQYSGGFVAWSQGVYHVRVNSYAVAEAAQTDANQQGLAGWTVVQPSDYAVNVVVYATTDILFQFDGGAGLPLGVMPGTDDTVKTLALFKGFDYYGGFRYERLGGGNLTVVNILPLDDYVKGVVPYESNKLWPLETLKAQAICAKNYALTDLNKHRSYNFDVCNSSDCQVYWGNGNERAHPSDLSNQAVDETRGIYAWYNGKLAKTFFCSSNGGGTENVINVWGGSGYPYLAGVVDPFEADVADIANYYNWSNSFTAEELTAILQERGYATDTTVTNFEVTEYSATGNVLAVKFSYANGGSNTFVSRNSSWLRSKLGCRSLHFTVAGSGQEMPQGLSVNDGTGTRIEHFSGLYVTGADGTVLQLQEEIPHVITGGGEVVATAKPSVIPKDTYVVTGTGWGHNIGYSQWGGYAMAMRGYTYDEILKFYYTGIEVGPKS